MENGANEATTIEFDKPVKIEGKDLAAGKYALFTIPVKTNGPLLLTRMLSNGVHSNTSRRMMFCACLLSQQKRPHLSKHLISLSARMISS
jgi:hypothetical protein